jgi:hypothetical protein
MFSAAALYLFAMAFIGLVIGLTFWLVDPNRKGKL